MSSFPWFRLLVFAFGLALVVPAPAALAQEQWPAQGLLQLLDLHADRRRRAEDTLGGAGEAAGLRDCDKGPDEVGFEQLLGAGGWSVHGSTSFSFSDLLYKIISFD